MKLEDKLLKALQFVFPEGNLWMHWLYIPTVGVMPILIYCLLIVLALTDAGFSISTDTFVASQTIATGGWTNNLPYGLTSLLFDWAMYVWAIFAVHEVASISTDIGYAVKRSYGDSDDL